jgi:hypothetical protein
VKWIWFFDNRFLNDAFHDGMGWVSLVVGHSGSFGCAAKVPDPVTAPIPIAVFRAEDLFMMNGVIGVRLSLL